jgi:hypothetical protein
MPSMAMQNVLVGHDTAMTCPEFGMSLGDDQETPRQYTARPEESMAMQRDALAHDTLSKPSLSIRIGEDQPEALKVTSSP